MSQWDGDSKCVKCGCKLTMKEGYMMTPDGDACNKCGEEMERKDHEKEQKKQKQKLLQEELLKKIKQKYSELIKRLQLDWAGNDCLICAAKEKQQEVQKELKIAESWEVKKKEHYQKDLTELNNLLKDGGRHQHDEDEEVKDYVQTPGSAWSDVSISSCIKCGKENKTNKFGDKKDGCVCFAKREREREQKWQRFIIKDYQFRRGW